MSERYLLKSRQPDADFEHRLVSADGEFEFYFRCSESAARELVEHLDSLHERIAAALNAQPQPQASAEDENAAWLKWKAERGDNWTTADVFNLRSAFIDGFRASLGVGRE